MSFRNEYLELIVPITVPWRDEPIKILSEKELSETTQLTIYHNGLYRGFIVLAENDGTRAVVIPMSMVVQHGRITDVDIINGMVPKHPTP